MGFRNRRPEKEPKSGVKNSFLVLPGVPDSSHGPTERESGGNKLTKLQVLVTMSGLVYIKTGQQLENKTEK